MSRARLYSILLWALIAAPLLQAHPGAAIAVAGDGRVFFVDTGGGIFSIQAGRVTRHEGPAYHWFAFDPQGRFRQTRWPSIPNGTIRTVGASPALILSSDFPVTIGSDGSFYYPDGTSGRVRITAVSPSGARSVRATLPRMQSGGRAAAWVNGLAAGPGGSLYYTEDAAVRRVDAQGRISAIATGIDVPNCTHIPGIGPEAGPYLRGLAVAPDGSIYVAASGCGTLLKIDPRGRVQPILRTSPPWSPTDVTIANGEVYVLEYSHTPGDDRRQWFPRVRKISRTGVVTMLGGSNRR
jgi:hypothetical protein